MLLGRVLFTTAIVASAFFLNACATSRSLLSLATPSSDKIAQANGMEIYIRSVADKRIFEVNPRSPEIPSLDPSEPQNDHVRRRAIARKRSTYGKGLGDILLNEGQTVESVITDTLRQAFVENGYAIVRNDPNLSSNSKIVDVESKKFWSWMNPGFWALTLSTEINTDIVVKGTGAGEKQTIDVKAADHFQTGVDGNWQSVMQSALRDYISEVKTKLK